MPSKRDIVVTERGIEPYKAAEDRTLGYVDPIRIGNALELCEWGIEDDLDILIDIAKNNESSPKQAMQAISMMHRIIKDSLQLSGRVGTLSARNEDGHTLTIHQVRGALQEFTNEEDHPILEAEIEDCDGTETKTQAGGGIHKPPSTTYKDTN